MAVLLRSIDATPYRGRKIRLRGALRIEPAGGDGPGSALAAGRSRGGQGRVLRQHGRPAGPAARLGRGRDRGRGRPGRQDGSSMACWSSDAARPGSTTSAWKSRAAAPAAPKEPPRPLAGRGLENLVAFTRLLGYVRHFHPSDEAAEADWDALAVAGVRAVEPATSAEDLASDSRGSSAAGADRPGLPDRQRAAAPGRIAATDAGRKPSSPGSTTASAAARSRPGCRFIAARGGDGTLAEGRRPEGRPDPSAPVPRRAGRRRLLPGAPVRSTRTRPVRCRTPRRRSHRAGSADPAGRPVPRETTARPGWPPWPWRWNVLRHFYPYFDVVKTDWPAALRGPRLGGDRSRRAGVPGDAAADGRRAPRRPRGRLPLRRRGRPGRLPAAGVGLGRRTARRHRRRGARRAGRAEARHQARRGRRDDRRPARRPGTGRRRAPDLRGHATVAAAPRPAGARRRSIRARSSCSSSKAGAGRRARSGSSESRWTSGRRAPPAEDQGAPVRGSSMWTSTGSTTPTSRKALPDLERARGIVFDFRGYPGRAQPAGALRASDRQGLYEPAMAHPAGPTARRRGDGVQAVDGLDALPRQAPPEPRGSRS